MSFGETLAKLRQDRGITQGELAAKVYVTRQAVSRWENGETTPGIDMCKLLAATLQVPISRLLEMPEYPVCQCCGMPLTDPEERAKEADGTESIEFCKHCYHDGHYRYEGTMDDVIEACAPYLVQYTGITLDEAVSLMGAMLPELKRWKAQ